MDLKLYIFLKCNIIKEKKIRLGRKNISMIWVGLVFTSRFHIIISLWIRIRIRADPDPKHWNWETKCKSNYSSVINVQYACIICLQAYPKGEKQLLVKMIWCWGQAEDTVRLVNHPQVNFLFAFHRYKDFRFHEWS